VRPGRLGLSPGVVTADTSTELRFRATARGLRGPANARAVADLVKSLGRGIRGAITSPAAVSPLRSDIDLGRLSSRELEIVTRLLAGDRVSSIAKLLFLSEGTVRNHLSSVFGKLGVRSQQELIDLLRAAPADAHRRCRAISSRAAAVRHQTTGFT